MQPFLVTVALACTAPVAPVADPTPPLTPAFQAQTVEALAIKLRDGYGQRELGSRFAEGLRARSRAGAYRNPMDGRAFAEALTADLRAILEDRHLRVEYSAEKLPDMAPFNLRLPEGFAEQVRPHLARENFGVRKVELLPGNVGYLRLDYFAPIELAASRYTAAFEMLADASALILDLRGGMGSMDPEAIPYFAAYLFDGSTHLSDVYWRPTDSVRQFWTAPHVPGRRFVGKPVHILVSSGTFSGCEAIAYDLQALRRVTVVGERTGGGANPGGGVRLNDHFTVWLPMGHVTNPITKGNWERVGVKPDVEVHPGQALREAQRRLLKMLIAAEKAPEAREALQAALSALSVEQARVRKVRFELAGYAGAKQVVVAGSFNFWSRTSDPLRRVGDRWIAEVPLEPGRHTYKFIVDGVYMADPANPQVAKESRYGDSVRIVD